MSNPKYPDSFYYEDPSAALSYTAVPTGHFSAPRLLNGSPDFWLKEGSVVPNKKTLVITDWTAGQWSVEKQFEQVQYYSDLIKDGFSLYVYQWPGEIVKLTKDNLYLLQEKEFRKNIQPVKKNEIIKLMASKRVPATQLECIPIGEAVQLSDVMDYDQDHLISYILSEYQGRINCDEIGKDALDSKEYLLKQYKGLHFIPNYTRINTNYAFIDIPIESYDLSNVDTLILKYPQNLKDVLYSNLLKKIPSPRVLTLQGSALFELNIPSDQFFDNLESLDLSYPLAPQVRSVTSINKTVLLKVLNKAHKLKFLNLHNTGGFSNIRIEEEDLLPDLEALEFLDLSNTSIDGLSLCRILAKTHNLKYLDISHCKKLNLADRKMNLHLIDNQFKHLETLVLEGGELGAQALGGFLSKAKKLKSLKLKDFYHFNAMSLEDAKFDHLEHLELSDTDINAQQLLDILKRAPKLKSLKLLSCNKIEDLDFEQLDPDHLSNLESLEAGSETGFLGNIWGLAAKAHNLRTFKLGGVSVHGVPSELHPDSFSNLKNVKISKHIPESILSDCFKKLKNLKNLDLNGCDAIVKLTKILPNDIFIQLDSLNLGKTKTDNAELLSILSKAKNLKVLNLKDCAYLENFDFSQLPEDVLSDLEVLELGSAHNRNINGEKLLKFSKTRLPKLNDESRRKLEDYCITYQAGIKKRQARELTASQERQIEPPVQAISSPSEAPSEAPLFDSPDKTLPKIKAIDADTTEKNSTYNLVQLFWGMPGTSDPNPSHYRLEVFDTVDITDNPKAPFIPCNKTDLKLINPPFKYEWIKDKSTYDCPLLTSTEPSYFAKKDIKITSEWQALPALSSNDKITHIHIEGVEESDVEIKYSERDSLYYIKTKSEQAQPINTKLDFRVTVPLSDRNAENASSKIRDLVKKYQNYGGGVLKVAPNATGRDRLTAIQTQTPGVGACRHRAVAFKDEVERLYPDIKVRVVGNDCHMFAEVQEPPSKDWVCCDLSGHDLKLVVNDHNAPVPSLISSEPKSISFAANDSLVDIESSRFNSWKSEKGLETEIPIYILNILNGKYSDKKTLVQFDAQDQINDFQLLLQKECLNTSRPVFYVNSPDDLRCSAPWIEQNFENNQGILRKAPGGALYEFLKKYQDNKPAPVLMVNWDNFSAREIVQFNSLLDKTRIVDGVTVPQSVHVIGLHVPKRLGAYNGVDFLGRFTKKTTCQFSGEQIKKHAEPLTSSVTEKVASDKTPVIIDLFDSPDWKTLLMGQWTLQGDSLFFKEGELKAALKKAKDEDRPLEIKNGPWRDPLFVQFLQQARLDGKIDKTLKIKTSLGYDWAELLSGVSLTNSGTLADTISVLNPGSLSYFFENYDHKEGKLYHKPGLLEQNKNKSLDVYLTRELSAHQWGRLLACAKTNNVSLKIRVAPKVQLPEGFPTLAETPALQAEKSSVYLSSDIDYTVHELKKQLAQENVHPIVLDISECEASDLLISLTAKLDETDKNKPRYEFTQKINAVLAALQKGKTIILKGNFKPDLIDALAPLCLEKPSQCILVTQPQAADNFSFVPCTFSIVPEQYRTKSFIQTQTETHYLAHHLGGRPEDNYQGMKHIEHAPASSGQSPSIDLEACKAFEAERLQVVTETLKYNPFVFMTGKTGVGKSSFVKKVIEADDKHYNVHYGKEASEAWATDPDPDPTKTKILFIDEVNIDSGDCSAFEGLYNTKIVNGQEVPDPGILIKGTYHPLTSQHKVIFAGNPLSYGGRSSPAFFERHGGARIFKPLTTDYLYHRVLFPILKDLNPELAQTISTDILKTYQYIAALPESSVLISPRELQMMAVLISTNTEKQAHFIHSVAEQCIPAQYKTQFNEWFKKDIGDPTLTSEIVPVFTHPDTKFLVTESRLPAYQKMVDFLKLRDFKQNTKNEASKYAGLGGIILEGEPGIGKSQFVYDVLINHGFKKVELSNLQEQTGRIFYDLKASLSISEKKALLIKAFNEGAVVIMDEMNTDPNLEKLLNALLMGYGPDGKPPKVPGFMIIATQNPISMAGRSAESVALERRFMKIYLPEYIASEMRSILINIGLEIQRAAQLVKEYMAVRLYGLKNGRDPLPTFRQLQDVAEDYITADIRHKQYPMPAIRDAPSQDTHAQDEPPIQASLWKRIQNGFIAVWKAIVSGIKSLLGVGKKSANIKIDSSSKLKILKPPKKSLEETNKSGPALHAFKIHHEKNKAEQPKTFLKKGKQKKTTPSK